MDVNTYYNNFTMYTKHNILYIYVLNVLYIPCIHRSAEQANYDAAARGMPSGLHRRRLGYWQSLAVGMYQTDWCFS